MFRGGRRVSDEMFTECERRVISAGGGWKLDRALDVYASVKMKRGLECLLRGLWRAESVVVHRGITVLKRTNAEMSHINAQIFE